MLARRMKSSRHGDDVTGDVAKTGDTSSLYCCFSAVIKAMIALHKQGLYRKSRTLTQQNNRLFCSSTSLAHFV